MTCNFELSVYTPRGQLVTILDDVLSIDASLRTNDAGTMTIAVPCGCNSGIDTRLDDFDRDYRLELCIELCEPCAATGAQYLLFGSAPFFVRKLERCVKNGKCTLNILAEHANGLLRRRLAAYKPKSNEAKANGGPADTQIYRIFKESFGDRAGNYTVQDGSNHDATRELAYFDGLITFDDSTAGCGPAWSSKYGSKSVLSAMQDAATSAESKGTPVFFGLEQSGGCGGGPLQFYARCNQWGTDRSNGIVASEATQTVEDNCTSFDWSKEQNRVYVMGGDDPSNSANYSIADSDDLAATLADNPFALVETYTSDKNYETADERIDAGKTLLGRVQIAQFSGTLTDRENFRFGCAWNYGDRIPVQIANGQILSAIVAGVHFNAQNNAVTLSADLTLGTKSGAISGMARLAQDVNALRAELAALRALIGS